MTSRTPWASASALCSIFLLLPPGLCHMEMDWPYALRSKFNPANPWDSIDYSMTSPLQSDGSDFPCKGYQNDRGLQPVTTYTAGSMYNMSLSGSATHEGGSCQLSLSYDHGASFRVIKSMIGGCPLRSTYQFTIPPYMPAGNALFAWTWQNKVGNREYYMNCAQVSIKSGYSSRKQRREAVTNFDALPHIWRTDLGGFDVCGISEGSDPIYPNPGPDVEYGDNTSSETSPSPGECDKPTPYGQAYRAVGNAEAPISYSYESTTSAEAAARSTETTAQGGVTSVESSNPPYTSKDGVVDDYVNPQSKGQARAVLSSSEISPAATSTPTYSTMTVYVDCPDTITLTIYPSPATSITAMPSRYTTSAACTGTSALCPCAQGFACDEISPCTWACNARPAPTLASAAESWSQTRKTTWTTRTVKPTSRSTFIVSRTYTVTPVKPSSRPSSQSTNRPPYATGDLERYLPCVPGTFICTSETTWETCNWNDRGTEWVYGYPRRVVDGMMCLTNLSPSSSETGRYAQQALTPAGFSRDDRIVRERPDGDCDVDGSLGYADGGRHFNICDHGGWVRMGSVAAGTRCENGRIVADS